MRTFSFYLTVASGAVMAAAAPPLHGQTAPHSLPAVTWWTGAEKGDIDRGIGIAYLANAPGGILGDTVLVRAEPDSGAGVIGAFLYHETPRVSNFGVAAVKRLRPNVLEFRYEFAGIPIDSLATGGGWARVILGFDSQNAAYRGWVSIDSTHLKYLLWKKELLRRDAIFFLPDQEPRFFLEPGGKELSLGIRKGWENLDYIMHPMKARGPWLKVRVAQPPDICIRPDEIRSRMTVAWVRYLTPRGRPRVWYGTRGC